MPRLMLRSVLYCVLRLYWPSERCVDWVVSTGVGLGLVTELWRAGVRRFCSSGYRGSGQGLGSFSCQMHSCDAEMNVPLPSMCRSHAGPTCVFAAPVGSFGWFWFIFGCLLRTKKPAPRAELWGGCRLQTPPASLAPTNPSTFVQSGGVSLGGL
jgi:hypothetical protein